LSEYHAPVRDMSFALNALAGVGNLAELPDFRDVTPDLVDAVLEEAARLASDVLAPLNRTGDRTGSRVENRAVVTPPGFRDAYRAFREGGWPALSGKPERGGQGLPELVAAAANEIWQSANMAFALCPMLTEGTVYTLEQHGSATIRDRYIPRLVSGEWTAAMDLTEPQAGSDLAAVKTRAEPRGDHYLLTGQKIFITWGDHDLADNVIHMVLARLPDAPPGIRGISLFLVPKFLVNDDGSLGGRNDVYPVSVEHKLGIHASPTCIMSYGDNGGATGYLVGEPHGGIAFMFTLMNHARLAVGIQGLSISERAYQQARDYARQRVQGQARDSGERVAIIRHADVRRMLMLMKAGTEAMRALCYATAASVDWMHRSPDSAIRERHGVRFALLTPIVKAWCTELAQEMTYLALQVHGGMGFIEETGVAQHFRDARITTIYEGTTGIQANDLVGRKLLRDGGAALRDLLSEMRDDSGVLKQHAKTDLRDIGERLEGGIRLLEQAGAWLVENHGSDPDAPGAAAVNFLMLAGTVCGAWQMGRAAQAAARLIDSGAPDRDFLEAKRITARFYCEHILPRAFGYTQAVLAGSAAVMALGDDQF
jgi:alkylation response protein AidB-like acyl-CoA dehydrogenase